MDTPAGFEPYPTKARSWSTSARFSVREDGDGPPALGVRAEERHANHRGTIQGGFLSTFADFALGRAIEFDATDDRERATVSLTVDFLKPAEPGDWIEARTQRGSRREHARVRRLHPAGRRARVSSRKSRIRRRRLKKSDDMDLFVGDIDGIVLGPSGSPVGDTLGCDDRLATLPGLELTFPPSQAAGVVNVTADSFYSGARSVTPAQAVEDGLRLAEAGFDLLDVGAVAARSGPPVEAKAEIANLRPRLRALRARRRARHGRHFPARGRAGGARRRRGCDQRHLGRIG